MLSAGNAYKTAKTKLYPDGTTNTICCKTAIFKDSDIWSSEKVKIERFKEIFKEERAQKLETFLHNNGLSFEDVLIYFKGEKSDFLKQFPNFPDCLGVSMYDWLDFCAPYKQRISEKRVLGEPRPDSMKRAKDSIFDFVLCNNFQYFFTGTINPELLDSTSPEILVKPVTSWLKELVRRYDASYIMVAERHKKGGIHFHGLLRSEKPLALADSGTKLYKGHKRPIKPATAARLGLTDGRTVYNLKSWRFGFSTAIELTGDRLYTAFYVTKYITKDVGKTFGRFFWHSRNLQKPKIIIHDLDFESIESAEFNGFKYQFKRNEEKINE